MEDILIIKLLVEIVLALVFVLFLILCFLGKMHNTHHTTLNADIKKLNEQHSLCAKEFVSNDELVKILSKIDKINTKIDTTDEKIDNLKEDFLKYQLNKAQLQNNAKTTT